VTSLCFLHKLFDEKVTCSYVFGPPENIRSLVKGTVLWLLEKMFGDA